MSIEIALRVKCSVEILNINRIVSRRIRIVSLETIATETSNEIGRDFSKSPQITSKIGRNNSGFSRKRSDCSRRSDYGFKTVFINQRTTTMSRKGTGGIRRAIKKHIYKVACLDTLSIASMTIAFFVPKRRVPSRISRLFPFFFYKIPRRHFVCLSICSFIHNIIFTI